jgi:hypothetical protein
MNAPKERYRLATGRTILRNEAPIAYLQRTGGDATGYSMAPAEADDLARQVVRALNRNPQMAQALRVMRDAMAHMQEHDRLPDDTCPADLYDICVAALVDAVDTP